MRETVALLRFVVDRFPAVRLLAVLRLDERYAEEGFFVEDVLFAEEAFLVVFLPVGTVIAAD